MTDGAPTKEDVLEALRESVQADRDEGRRPGGVSIERLAGRSHFNCEEREIRRHVRQLVFEGKAHSVSAMNGRSPGRTSVGYVPGSASEAGRRRRQ